MEPTRVSRNGQQSLPETPGLLPVASGPHCLRHYAIWQNFPGFSPQTAISSPTHQRNVKATRLALWAVGKMPVPIWLGAAHLQSTQPASKGHEAILSRSRHPPTRPSPSKPFPLRLIIIQGRGVSRRETVSHTSQSNHRTITPIACWLPHLSPSSSPAKANFPLTGG